MEGREREKFSNFDRHLSLILLHFPKECRNEGRFPGTNMANYCDKASMVNTQVNAGDEEMEEEGNIKTLISIANSNLSIKLVEMKAYMTCNTDMTCKALERN